MDKNILLNNLIAAYYKNRQQRADEVEFILLTIKEWQILLVQCEDLLAKSTHEKDHANIIGLIVYIVPYGTPITNRFLSKQEFRQWKLLHDPYWMRYGHEYHCNIVFPAAKCVCTCKDKN